MFTKTSSSLAGAAVALVLVGQDPAAKAPTVTGFDRSTWTPPGEALTLVQEHRYRMIGRVRPLLAFWIDRDNVGAGEIRWKRGEDAAVAYELVIGSDPARAPGGLNRWGYIAEEIRSDETRVLGVISKSDEDSLGAVRSGPGDATRSQQFETIRATVTSTQAQAMLSIVRTPPGLTYHDVRVLLDRVLDDSDPAKFRELARPPGTRPGFLSSVAELMGAQVRPGTRIPYIYGGHIYDLRLTSKVPLATFRLGDRAYERVIQSGFEIRDPAGSDRWRVELTYGTEGRLSGVPIVILYRPRWWLEVELRLEG
jgi:hypothetical protein